MATLAQIEANRRNALASTGPRTPAGKAISRMNATRHGLLARQAVLPDEDGDAFAGLLSRLWEELQPEGVLEETCVENIAAARWRLARARRIESEILASEMYGAEEALAAETAEALLVAWKFGEGASAEEAAGLEARVRQQNGGP